MAIYTTFFLCEPEALLDGFPGWRLPLAEPVRREYHDPSTGEVRIIETREPEGPDEAGEEPEREYVLVEGRGSYEAYLEGRLPSFVHNCPHWAAKGLTPIELDALIESVGIAGTMGVAIYCPPSSSALVFEFPPDFLAKLDSLDKKPGRASRRPGTFWSFLARLDSRDKKAVARRWAASIECTADIALALLKPLVALANRAADGQQMYLLIEW